LTTAEVEGGNADVGPDKQQNALTAHRNLLLSLVYQPALFGQTRLSLHLHLQKQM